MYIYIYIYASNIHMHLCVKHELINGTIQCQLMCLMTEKIQRKKTVLLILHNIILNFKK